MSIEVKVPAVGESITSGVLSMWHKQAGDLVSEGEALFTLETDKISTEVPAARAGKLQIQVEAGQEVKIGQVVALLDETVKAPAPSAKPSDPAKAPAPPMVQKESNATLSPAARRIVEEEKGRLVAFGLQPPSRCLVPAVINLDFQPNELAGGVP